MRCPPFLWRDRFSLSTPCFCLRSPPVCRFLPHSTGASKTVILWKNAGHRSGCIGFDFAAVYHWRLILSGTADADFRLRPCSDRRRRSLSACSWHLIFPAEYFPDLPVHPEKLRTRRGSAVISSVSVVINIFLNAAFIFGIGFFPEMGIAGAALATVLSKVIELFWGLSVMLKKDYIKIRLRYAFVQDKTLRSDWKYTLPILGMNWSGALDSPCTPSLWDTWEVMLLLPTPSPTLSRIWSFASALALPQPAVSWWADCWDRANWKRQNSTAKNYQGLHSCRCHCRRVDSLHHSVCFPLLHID